MISNGGVLERTPGSNVFAFTFCLLSSLSFGIMMEIGHSSCFGEIFLTPFIDTGPFQATSWQIGSLISIITSFGYVMSLSWIKDDLISSGWKTMNKSQEWIAEKIRCQSSGICKTEGQKSLVCSPFVCFKQRPLPRACHGHKSMPSPTERRKSAWTNPFDS